MSKLNKNVNANTVTKTAVTLRGEDLDILIELGEVLNANSEIVVALALSYKYGLETSANLFSPVGTKKFLGDVNVARRQTFIKHNAEQKEAMEALRKDKRNQIKMLGHNFSIDNVSLVQAALFKFHTDFKSGLLDWNSTPYLSKFAKCRKIK